jgi:hypothetical protein
MQLAVQYIEDLVADADAFVLISLEMSDKQVAGIDLHNLDPEVLLDRLKHFRAVVLDYGVLPPGDEARFRAIFEALADLAIDVSRKMMEETDEELLAAAVDEPHEAQYADPDGESPTDPHKRDPQFHANPNAFGIAGGVSHSAPNSTPVWSTSRGSSFPETVRAIVTYVSEAAMPMLLKQFGIRNLNDWLVWEDKGLIPETFRRMRDGWLGGAGHSEILSKFFSEFHQYRAEE